MLYTRYIIYTTYYIPVLSTMGLILAMLVPIVYNISYTAVVYIIYVIHIYVLYMTVHMYN